MDPTLAQASFISISEAVADKETFASVDSIKSVHLVNIESRRSEGAVTLKWRPHPTNLGQLVTHKRSILDLYLHCCFVPCPIAHEPRRQLQDIETSKGRQVDSNVGC